MHLLSRTPIRWTHWALTLGMAVALLGCGGGDGGGGGGGDAGSTTGSGTGGGGTITPPPAPTPPPITSDYTGPLPFEDAPLVASASVAGMCTDLRQKQFVRSYLDEVYLWPELVHRRNPANYADARSYFDAILAPTTVDRFSFSESVADADQREASEAFDVGIDWRNVGTESVQRWRIARVEPGSPAAQAGLQRGDILVDLDTNLYQPNAVAPFYYNLLYARSGQTGVYSADLTPRVITEDPVSTTTSFTVDGRRVGYVAFESHYGDAQDQLIAAAFEAQALGVQDLVVDLRYNSGGFLYIAASLASMIAPTTQVQQRPDFVRFIPNARQLAAAPYSAIAFSPSVWYAPPSSRYPRGTRLPQLNLSRLYVLTTGSTCSASESLINGLRGVGVQVHVIGNTTCGKPYGMAREDNCGSAFYPVEFRGENNLGQANFTNGFAPTCTVADDLDHPRGSPNEAMLAATLTHIRTGSCPTNAQGIDTKAALTQMAPMPRSSAFAPPQRERPGLALITPR